MTRVDVDGLIDRRLVISIGKEEYAFQVPKPLEKASDIRDLLIGVEADSDPIVPMHGARRATPEILEEIAVEMVFQKPGRAMARRSCSLDRASTKAENECFGEDSFA